MPLNTNWLFLLTDFNAGCWVQVVFEFVSTAAMNLQVHAQMSLSPINAMEKDAELNGNFCLA